MNEPTQPEVDNEPPAVTVSISVDSFAELIIQLDALAAKMTETMDMMRQALVCSFSYMRR